MRFEYYVLNYDFNGRKVKMFNVFNNIKVQEYTEKEIKRYLRSPKNYKVKFLRYVEQKDLTGFDALCEEIRSILQWQLWSRCEYEISVGDLFEKDIDKFEKWDCYMQCLPNIKMITRDIIWQYKEQIKELKTNNN